jgi:DNA polymerase (family 10)
MTNKDIAGKIKLLADLLELHGENAFKVKNYANAYLNIRKFPGNLTESSEIDIVTLSRDWKICGCQNHRTCPDW